MTNYSDFTSEAKALVTDVINQHFSDHSELDLDDSSFQDDIQTRISEETDSLCIYYSDCDKYIQALESEWGTQAEDYVGDVKFSPFDHLKASTVLASALVHCALSAAVQEYIEEVEQDTDLIEFN